MNLLFYCFVVVANDYVLKIGVMAFQKRLVIREGYEGAGRAAAALEFLGSMLYFFFAVAWGSLRQYKAEVWTDRALPWSMPNRRCIAL